MLTLKLVLKNLVKIQRLDEQIDKLKKVHHEGPQKLAETEAALLRDEQLVHESLNREQEMLKRRRELEREVEDAEEKFKQNQAKQIQVKTNEEYRALLKENDYLRKEKSRHEDEVLELMEALESLAQENIDQKAWLEERNTETVQKKQEIEEEILASDRDLKILARERSEIITDIPQNYMALYERVYIKCGGRAVVPIEDGVCQQCHLQIPPQKFNELQRNDQIMTCPHCGRIIYWAGHQDFG